MHISKSQISIKTTLKRRGFLYGYKPLLPARVSRRCFCFVQAIAFDSRQPQKALFFSISFFLLFLVYTPVALLLRMDLRTLLHSFYPLRYRAFPALEYILQLLHHSTLQYLHNILHSKNACFQTYISDLHVCQTSLMLTFLSVIP